MWDTTKKLLALFLFLCGGSPAVAQALSGDRVTGVIYEKQSAGAPIPSPHATVCILNRDKTDDDTSADGLYYIVIPSDVGRFNVVAKKLHFESAVSRTSYDNQKDPVKADRLTLEPEDPKSSNIRQVVDHEIEVFHSAASQKLRSLILEDLKDISKGANLSDGEYITQKLTGLTR